MSEQGLQPIDVEYSATHSESTVQDTVQDTVQSSDCTVQSELCEPYTVKDLEKILGVQKRMVFTYAKTICSVWHWEHETVFKPTFGKYSQRALDEMKKLQAFGSEEYSKAIPRQNSKPTTGITGGLSILSDKIKSDSQGTLTVFETKVLEQQDLAITETDKTLDELKRLNAELALQRKRRTEAKGGGRAARIARLKAQAAREALEDFHIKKEAYDATFEELEIQEMNDGI